jgi:hypothetical protein
MDAIKLKLTNLRLTNTEFLRVEIDFALFNELRNDVCVMANLLDINDEIGPKLPSPNEPFAWNKIYWMYGQVRQRYEHHTQETEAAKQGGDFLREEEYNKYVAARGRLLEALRLRNISLCSEILPAIGLEENDLQDPAEFGRPLDCQGRYFRILTASDLLRNATKGDLAVLVDRMVQRRLVAGHATFENRIAALEEEMQELKEKLNVQPVPPAARMELVGSRH